MPPQGQSPGANIFPQKPKPGPPDPVAPLAEVDFLLGFRAPWEAQGPAERTRAQRDGSRPAGRIRAPRDKSGSAKRIRAPQYESGPRGTDQDAERRVRAPVADLVFEVREGKHYAARVVGENSRRPASPRHPKKLPPIFILGFRPLHFEVWERKYQNFWEMPSVIFRLGKESRPSVPHFRCGTDARDSIYCGRIGTVKTICVLEPSRRDLSNAVSPVSLRSLVWELAWGGGLYPRSMAFG